MAGASSLVKATRRLPQKFCLLIASGILCMPIWKVSVRMSGLPQLSNWPNDLSLLSYGNVG